MADHLQTHRKSVSRDAKRKPVRNTAKRASTRSAQKRVSARAGEAKRATQQKSTFSDAADKVVSFLSGLGKDGDNAPKQTGSRKRQDAGSSAVVDSLKTRFFSSRIAMVIAIVIVFLLALGAWDNLANLGKAYGNVSIDGVSVAGMGPEQMRSTIDQHIGAGLSDTSITIYASEEARKREEGSYAKQEAVAQAEQVSTEDANAAVTSWNVSAHSVNAAVPYDDIINRALAAGRDEGILGRFKLFLSPIDIPLALTFDEAAIESLASNIDTAIGDARTDSTVEISSGQANAVRGHDGKMVDRNWLKGRLSELFLRSGDDNTLTAEASDAPSRTSYEQAQQLAASINRVLGADIEFRYKSESWKPTADEVGSWTKVEVAQVQDGYELKADVDVAAATTDLVKNIHASEISGKVNVDFEMQGDTPMVKTSGSGIIPEVGPAIETASQSMYGPSGIAWTSDPDPRISIEVGESNAPESLTFEQAHDLGIITIIGEYTTEFSNAEGTENRNHNIKLAADLLNNSIVDGSGGTWSFNEHSGDTNQDPPFASAGSIVDGEYVDSIGGGICQVATTVFNAVYESGLEVVERHNHSLYIESYPTGRDAAVSYPEMDLIWKNQFESDVFLTLEYTDTSLTAKIYGVPTGLKVSTQTGEWEEGEKYKTTFETDESLERGGYYLKTTGSDGSQIAVIRTVTDSDGDVVKEDSFTSIYSPKDEVYLIGPGTDTSHLVRDTSGSMYYEEEQSSEDYPMEDDAGAEEYYETEDTSSYDYSEDYEG